jgi:hypothetical protein
MQLLPGLGFHNTTFLWQHVSHSQCKLAAHIGIALHTTLLQADADTQTSAALLFSFQGHQKIYKMCFII